jgi:dihydrofolate reductase
VDDEGQVEGREDIGVLEDHVVRDPVGADGEDLQGVQPPDAGVVRASRTLTDVSAWANSTLIRGELPSEVQRLRRDQDVVVIGSTSVVHELMQHDLVDEFRLLVFPTVLGAGRRLFESPAGADDLRLASVEQSGAAALLRYEKAGR